jgi:hypothetical protein
MRDEAEDRLYQCHRAALNDDIDRLFAALGLLARRALGRAAGAGGSAVPGRGAAERKARR